MLCLSGFELYSRWVPLQITMAMFNVIRRFPLGLIIYCNSKDYNSNVFH